MPLVSEVCFFANAHGCAHPLKQPHYKKSELSLNFVTHSFFEIFNIGMNISISSGVYIFILAMSDMMPNIRINNDYDNQRLFYSAADIFINKQLFSYQVFSLSCIRVR